MVCCSLFLIAKECKVLCDAIDYGEMKDGTGACRSAFASARTFSDRMARELFWGLSTHTRLRQS